MPATLPLGSRNPTGASSARGSRNHFRPTGSATSSGSSATTGKARRQPPTDTAQLVDLRHHDRGQAGAQQHDAQRQAAVLPNHMLIARLHVTGVEPMPMMPSSGQKPYHPPRLPGTKNTAANTSAKANSDHSATVRTPMRSDSAPTTGASNDAMTPRSSARR